MDPPPPEKLDDQSKTQQLLFHIGYHPDNINSFEQKPTRWSLHTPTHRIWEILFHT